MTSDGRGRLFQVGAIGLAAGLFSGLFGVGGGVVVVPLLMAWLAYGTREATGTSLLAIGITATAAVAVQAAYGNVHVREGVLIGAPAVAGTLFGTWLQQRVPAALVRFLFSLLLTATAVILVVRAS